MSMSNKITIYQVLPRLLTNTQNKNVENGTIQENGCGKINDITLSFLKRIKSNGFSHIWYTGIIEHATQTDYSQYGIRPDTHCIVKGKAGSPYAIKDYYDIDPDLCKDVQHRMKEFDALVDRTHKAGLKMIIDFVPNHVAREYQSDSKPLGISDLGEDDDPTKDFDVNNNFYYIPGQQLQLNFIDSGASQYVENPAKATGNNQFCNTPNEYDWYETIKLNYGINFFHNGESFFSTIPNTWNKMLEILQFWAAKGVDGFRCDMAEMVPCEFWNWCIPQIKSNHPEILFIAEVYNPSLYRQYIEFGHFDYLYDKVGLYDTLCSVCKGQNSAYNITTCWQNLQDLQPKMLNFLENHDEQRLASDFICKDPRKALPALVVSSCMNTNPFMIYAGQELGEAGMDKEGFSGVDGRTSIFDYWHVKSLYKIYKGERYMTKQERDLYKYYKNVITIAHKEPCINNGKFFDLMYVNNAENGFDGNNMYAFLRSHGNEAILAIANFNAKETQCRIHIPSHAITYMNIKEGTYKAYDLIHQTYQDLKIKANQETGVKITGNDAVLLKFAW